jgi:hypothetical protein
MLGSPDLLALGGVGKREPGCVTGRVEEGRYSRPQYTAINSPVQRVWKLEGEGLTRRRVSPSLPSLYWAAMAGTRVCQSVACW